MKPLACLEKKPMGEAPQTNCLWTTVIAIILVAITVIWLSPAFFVGLVVGAVLYRIGSQDGS